MARKKSAVNQVVDSFIKSVNQTGEGFAGIKATIFLAGGLFATYIGYTERSIILIAGGLVSLLIGLMVGYKSLIQSTSKNRRRR